MKANRQHRIAFCCLLPLFAGSALAVEPLSDPARRAYFSGFEIFLSTNMDRYIEGEKIQLTAEIRSASPRVFPLAQLSFSDFIHLECLEYPNMRFRPRVLITNSNVNLGPPTILKTYKFELNETMSCSACRRTDSCGFGHFPPGRFRVQMVDMESNEVSFVVDPIPPELADDWRVFNRMRGCISVCPCITAGPEAVLDSMRRWVDFFLAKPRQARWRPEAFTAALTSFGVFRELWQPGDSLLCREIVIELAHENRATQRSAPGGADATVFKKLERAEKYAVMREFANELNMPRFSEATEEIIRDDSTHEAWQRLKHR